MFDCLAENCHSDGNGVNDLHINKVYTHAFSDETVQVETILNCIVPLVNFCTILICVHQIFNLKRSISTRTYNECQAIVPTPTWMHNIYEQNVIKARSDSLLVLVLMKGAIKSHRNVNLLHLIMSVDRVSNDSIQCIQHSIACCLGVSLPIVL